MKIKEVYTREMFTRVPTFIPTSSIPTTSTDQSRNVKEKTRTEKAKTTYIKTQEPASRRRKRTIKLRKRLATKKSEDSGYVGDMLPIINQNTEEDSKIQTLQTPSHHPESRNTKLTDMSRATTPEVLLPYTMTEIKKNKCEKNDSRLLKQLHEHSPTSETGRRNDEITEQEMILRQGTEMLTQPRLHKRNGRKITEDMTHHDIKTKRHAKNEFANLEGSESMGNVNITTKSKPVMNRLDRLHRHEVDGANFRSKIPVRFPGIQANKRHNSNIKMNEAPMKLEHSLPPIYNVNYQKMTDNSGQVTQSILDYQNKLEKDFQRLGENLENTFKLLHRYIACSSSTDSDSNP